MVHFQAKDIGIEQCIQFDISSSHI
ncbi:hypothetical protein HMPREF0666_03393, partial [Prevotella sp. C561]